MRRDQAGTFQAPTYTFPKGQETVAWHTAKLPLSGVFAVGVSPAILLGMVATLCSVVPVVGRGLVWGPAAIYLMATGHMVKGIVLLAIGGGVISMLDNIIRPLVVSNAVQANGLVSMLSMLGGVAAFGFLGLFIGPVLIALVAAVSTMLKEELTEMQ